MLVILWVSVQKHCPVFSAVLCSRTLIAMDCIMTTPLPQDLFLGPSSGRQALVGAQRAGKENCCVPVLLLSSRCHGSGGTAFNAPSRWPSSMLQGRSGLQYHGPSSSAFPTAPAQQQHCCSLSRVASPTFGGCSHSVNVPSLNSFQLNFSVLSSVSCWD